MSTFGECHAQEEQGVRDAMSDERRGDDQSTEHVVLLLVTGGYKRRTNTKGNVVCVHASE